MIGLLVGDALGASYEFKSSDRIPSLDQIEMTPPSGFPKPYQIPDGTWTDDGSQALVLLESLLEQGGFDGDDFGRRLLRWHDGYMWVDGTLFDIGGATRAAIQNLRAGQPALEAGVTGDDSNGCSPLRSQRQSPNRSR